MSLEDLYASAARLAAQIAAESASITVSHVLGAPEPPIELEISGDPGAVWRVGYAPNPWAWTPWVYANEDTRLFPGRWDDQQGQFRTIYTADSLLGCFLEMLAVERPQPKLTALLEEIEDDDGSIGRHPEAADGEVGYAWLDGRMYGRAMQRGRYCEVTHSTTVSTLALRYPLAVHGISPKDFDVSMLKTVKTRPLTRSIARWLYDLYDNDGPRVDGVAFSSRHGDDMKMWAVFERPDDTGVSPLIAPTSDPVPVAPDLPELVEAFRLLGLRWREV